VPFPADTVRMWSLPRVVAVLVAVAVVAPAATADASMRQDPQLSALSLTEPAIHAVGVTGTGLPKKTHLLLTLSEPSLVRIRVKDTDPYGLSRAFNVNLPAGSADVAFSARVDGTKLPPGKYRVVVKAHSPNGSSDKKYLRLRIVGKNG
jgi:hypothetical protein